MASDSCSQSVNPPRAKTLLILIKKNYPYLPAASCPTHRGAYTKSPIALNRTASTVPCAL